MRKVVPLVGVVVVGSLGVGCARRAPAPPHPLPRVANAALGIVVDELPSAFRVVSNEGERLVLAPKATDDPARLTIAVGPLQPKGVNLVHWVETQPGEFTGKAEGVFLGAKKLITPIGTAYSARGRYRTEHGLVEEMRILAVHPAAPRLLMASYVYPAGADVTVRAQQLLDIFAQIEALAPATPAPH
jgi:hypothetical protein